MAATVNENVNPKILWEDPKEVVEEPPQRFEAPRAENAPAVTAGKLQVKLA